MMPLLVLFLACSGPSPEAGQALPESASLDGIELRLPGPGLVLRAAHAQTLATEPRQGEASQVTAELGDAPGLSIESAHASWDLRAQNVVFEQDVTAVRGAFTLRCQRLEASFDSPEQLSRAEASGDVTVTHGERVATGQRAVLDVQTGRLELGGQPTVTEGGRSLRGERIVLFLDDERLECDQCVLDITPVKKPSPVQPEAR